MKVYVSSITKKIIGASENEKDLRTFFLNCFVLDVDKVEDKTIVKKVWLEEKDANGKIIWEQSDKGLLSVSRKFKEVLLKVKFIDQPYLWSLDELKIK